MAWGRKKSGGRKEPRFGLAAAMADLRIGALAGAGFDVEIAGQQRDGDSAGAVAEGILATMADLDGAGTAAFVLRARDQCEIAARRDSDCACGVARGIGAAMADLGIGREGIAAH